MITPSALNITTLYASLHCNHKNENETMIQHLNNNFKCMGIKK